MSSTFSSLWYLFSLLLSLSSISCGRGFVWGRSNWLKRMKKATNNKSIQLIGKWRAAATAPSATTRVEIKSRNLTAFRGAAARQKFFPRFLASDVGGGGGQLGRRRSLMKISATRFHRNEQISAKKRKFLWPRFFSANKSLRRRRLTRHLLSFER